MTQMVNRSDIVPTQEALQRLEEGILNLIKDEEETEAAILAFDPLAKDKNGNWNGERCKAYGDDYLKKYEDLDECVGRSYCYICDRWSGGYEDTVSGSGHPALCEFCWEKDAVQEVMRRMDPNEIVFVHKNEKIPEHLLGMNPVVVKQEYLTEYKRLTKLQKFEQDLSLRVRMKKESIGHYDRLQEDSDEYDNLIEHYTHYRYIGKGSPKLHVDCLFGNEFAGEVDIDEILFTPQICKKCILDSKIHEVYKRVDPDKTLKTICMEQSE